MRQDPKVLDASASSPFAGREPLPRRKLSGGVLALLIGLRIYVLLAIPLVGYAFVHALTASR